MKKKICLLMVVLFSICFVVGCGSEKHIDGALSDIMAKLYENIPDDERPMMLSNTEVNETNVEYYLGLDEVTFEEALASEPMVTSIAHSVVLIRASENQDIEALKKDIRESVDPVKWICVSVEEDDIIVDNIGDLVILIMDNTGNSERIHDNFNNLK